MGVCCCGTSGEPSDRRTCEEIGCDYYEDPTTSCTCALTVLLTEYLTTQSREDPVILLAAGGTYTSLYDLRDQILAKSRLGQQLLDYYHRFAEQAVTIARSDPDFIREALRVFLVGASFGRAVLREYDRRDRDAIGDRRFTGEAYESGIALLARFRQMAPDDAFDEPIQFLEREISRFVGMTPREALDTLMDDA